MELEGCDDAMQGKDFDDVMDLMIQEALDLRRGWMVYQWSRLKMIFVRVLRWLSKKRKLKQRIQEAWWSVKQKQTMWATNDKGVLFVQNHENKSEDATLQVKTWWSNLLMEMLLKVALQVCGMCSTRFF